eukprot:gene7755-biopygen18068
MAQLRGWRLGGCAGQLRDAQGGVPLPSSADTPLSPSFSAHVTTIEVTTIEVHSIDVTHFEVTTIEVTTIEHAVNLSHTPCIGVKTCACRAPALRAGAREATTRRAGRRPASRMSTNITARARLWVAQCRATRTLMYGSPGGTGNARATPAPPQATNGL